MTAPKTHLRLEQCQNFILVADQFDETFVINTLAQRHGVGIVAVQNTPIQGCHGLTILPDFTIGELLSYCQLHHTTLIIPGGERCLATLFSEPRVYNLIEHRLQAQSEHAIMTIPPAYSLMLKAGLTNVNPANVLTSAGKDFS